jgi:NAD(P)H-dependent flavin oxidoreductase YrpB (nitropropane dioxygenase family)
MIIPISQSLESAAVTNAGGMGVIGGLGYTPEQLRAEVSNQICSHL